MNTLITKKVGWNYLNNSNTTPSSYNYDELNSIVNKGLIDKRTATKDSKSLIDDFSDVCKKSIIPLPGFIDSEDDVSSESYVPHSDWQGPSGEAWIGK